MSLFLLGTGFVTPLGNELDEVWGRILAGEMPPALEFPQRAGAKTNYYLPVPPKQVEALGRTPRIRRSSSITYFSVTAGLAALANAGISPTPEAMQKTALVFAIASGGVLYTRRFYDTILKEGPLAASPLLFPETVYNAPASHLAAMLGTDAATYTLVGDGSIGISALAFADQLLACHPELEQCIVVAAEECDWILSEAYASWRLLTRTPRITLGIHGTPSGMLLAEGAAALVVGRTSNTASAPIQIQSATAPFLKRKLAGHALQSILKALPIEGSDLVIASANGTWVDRLEASELRQHLPNSPVFYPKTILGETLGAGSLLQVALAAEGLKRASLPLPSGSLGTKQAAPLQDAGKITVTSVGLNGEVGAAVVSKGK